MRIILFLLPFFLIAQSSLEEYLNVAQSQNLGMKQQQFSYEQGLKQLDQARALFLPQLDLNARYTKSGGGRTIDFPLGDMLNPLYESTGLPMRVENQSFPLMREKEHETKLTLVQHLFHLKIYYNYKLKSSLSEIRNAEKHAFLNELTKRVKHAYFDILKAERAIELYASAEKVLAEHKRVTEQLFKNDKLTKDAVYLAESEHLNMSQNVRNARHQFSLAKQYFNHLLNRELGNQVETEFAFPITKPEQHLNELKELSFEHRFELKQLQAAVQAAKEGVKISQSSFVPNLLLSANYGYQGETYAFDSDHDFWNASAVVQWNVFNGLQDKASVEENELSVLKQNALYSEVKGQIELQIEQSYHSMMNQFEQVNVSQLSFQNAEEAFRIIEKKYQEGMVSQLEYLQAQSKQTQTKINADFAKIEFHKSLADLEFAVGTQVN